MTLQTSFLSVQHNQSRHSPQYLIFYFTERLLVKVSDPAHYHEVDQSFSVSKHRKGGLPIDEARQAFRSHITRLRNMDKSRLTDEEKKLIDARKSAMSTAEKLYIALQKQALGISPENNSVPPVPALPTSVLRMFLAKRDVEQVGDAAGLPKEVQQTLATNVTAHDAAMRKNEGRYFDLFWKEQFGVGREDARKRLAAHEGCFERVESYHKGLIVLLREQLVRPKEGMDSVVRRHAKSYSDVLLKTFQSMNPTIPFKEFHGRYMEPADLGRQKPQVSPTPASSSKPQPPRDNNTPTPSLGCSV